MAKYTKEEKVVYHAAKKAAYEAEKAAKSAETSQQIVKYTKEEKAVYHAAKKAAKRAAYEAEKASKGTESSVEFSVPQPVIDNTKLPIDDKKGIADFIFEENIFSNIISSISYNREVVYTNFTDEQAVAICGKMADGYARLIASNYIIYQNHIQGSVLRYQIHLLANKALNLYGGPLLTFLYKLRPLRFKAGETFKVKYLKDSSSVGHNSVHFPTLTFKTTRENQFTLAFHLNKAVPNKKERNPIHIFRNGRHIGSISKRGKTFDPYGNKLKSIYNTKPTLLIFCEFLKKSKSPAFYSGVETGNCFVCGRTLTDPDSILYGIGPVCLGKF